MLNETTLELLSERITNRIESLNSHVLREIGGQINRIGTLTPTNAQRLVNVFKYGGSLDNIARELSIITRLNVSEIYEIFEELAKTETYFAKQFYDYRGIDHIPYETNIELQAEVKSLADKVVQEYLNLSNTTAFIRTSEDGNKIVSSIAETYQNVIDEAIIAISQGKNSYNDTMKRTIQELSEGIKTVNYESGYSRRLDSSVRMNIMDGMRDLHNSMQERIGQEVGNDGVEISVHENPAPDHAPYQGKQFSLEEYRKLNETLDRPISTMNCYHYIYSIVLGVSEPRYSKEELEEINKRNKQGFEFEGKKYSMYEGKQLQRKIETAIRKEKDLQIIAKASGNDETVYDSQKKVSYLNKKYKQLSEVSGLPMKMERLQVDNFKRKSVNMKDYYDENLRGIEINNVQINDVSIHLIRDRRAYRSIKVEMVEDALKNPVDIGIMKVDEKGRKSFKVIGEQATITINPDNGRITTAWRTSEKTLKKYRGD